MSTYAIDPQRREITVICPTAQGTTVTFVALIPATCLVEDATVVAAAATELSEALWLHYDANESLDPDAFAYIETSITTTRVVDGEPLRLPQGAVPAAACELGWVLGRIGDVALTAAIAADVAAEFAAVQAAYRGVLTGRGSQVVARSRTLVGQVHLDAAEALLRSDSLDEHRLRSELDPLAAASAAIPYLAAALHETASAAHLPLHRVMDEAADMEETDKTGCDAARAVIDRLFEVDDPQRVATHLVSECKDAAAGCLPDMRRLLADINVAKASARRLAPGDRAVRDEFLDAIRATPLEPLRPAPSLLDAVLAGIEGCFHVWRHHASATTGAAADVDDELDDALENAMEEARRQEFWAHVQARVAAEHGGIRAFASVM